MSTQVQSWIGRVIGSGRYEIRSVLGKGGMGIVFLALDKSLDTEVVVKVPRQHMLEIPEFVERFQREIRSLVKLSHPRVVKIHDVGIEGQLPYCVMQYLSGGSLEDKRTLNAEGMPLPMDPSAMLGWLPHVAEALDFVHQQGYIHRDIKPGNILFDSHQNAYLSDFGVAKVLAGGPKLQGSTQTGAVLGTAEYLAPELALGKEVDGRADQYALGITLYELLAGRKPFEGTTLATVLLQQASEEPPSLQELRPDLPQEIVGIVHRVLEKKPEQRFASCAELANAFCSAVQGRPQTAMVHRSATVIQSPGTSWEPMPLQAQAVEAEHPNQSQGTIILMVSLAAALALIAVVLLATIGLSGSSSSEPSEGIVAAETQPQEKPSRPVATNPKPVVPPLQPSEPSQSSGLPKPNSTEAPQPPLKLDELEAFAFLPEKATRVVFLRPSQVINSSFGEVYREEQAKLQSWQDQFVPLGPHARIPLAKLEYFLWAYSDLSRMGISIFKFSQPLESTDLVRAEDATRFERKKLAGQEIFLDATSGLSACFAAPELLVCSFDPLALKEVLQRKQAPFVPIALRAVLIEDAGKAGECDFRSPLVVFLLRPNRQGRPIRHRDDPPFIALEGGLLQLDVQEDIKLHSVLRYRDPRAAEFASENFSSKLQQFCTEHFSEFHIPESALAYLAGLKVRRQDKMLLLQWKLSQEEFRQIASEVPVPWQ